MDTTLRRALVAEGLGTFGVVYFAAGAVCVNFVTTTGQNPASSPLHGQQPGVVGIALAHGLIVAALLAVTARLSGGFLNPAITLMLWVFNRLDSKRTGYFLLVQLAAAIVAGACLRYTFADALLREARVGTPHINRPFAFAELNTATILACTCAELVLTFFLVLAIFGWQREGEDPARVALPAGLTLVAGTVVVYPLTGAAANPARWLGTILWEMQVQLPDSNPWGDTFVYLAGPILGALAAGLVAFRFLTLTPGEPTSKVQESGNKAPATAIKRK